MRLTIITLALFSPACTFVVQVEASDDTTGEPSTGSTSGYQGPVSWPGASDDTSTGNGSSGEVEPSSASTTEGGEDMSTGAANTTGEDSTTGLAGGDTTGALDTTGAEDLGSTGEADTSGSGSSTTGEPGVACVQADPAACAIGMCVSSEGGYFCAGDEVYTPGEVLNPQDAFVRHIEADARDLHVVSLPAFGSYLVQVVPQGVDFDTAITLYHGDGTLAGASQKAGQDSIEYAALDASTLILIVTPQSAGDYFVTVGTL